jgi:hypothetical protein
MYLAQQAKKDLQDFRKDVHELKLEVMKENKEVVKDQKQAVKEWKKTNKDQATQAVDEQDSADADAELEEQKAAGDQVSTLNIGRNKGGNGKHKN